MAAIESPEELASQSEAAVHVEVLDIGYPYFNSDDGGFWIPDESNGEAALGIRQNVRVSIIERWADSLSLPQTFDLTVFGGQLEVTLTEEQAEAAEINEGKGKYVYSFEPNVDLAEGERTVLFLSQENAPSEDGDAPVIFVKGGFQGKFKIHGEKIEDERGKWKLQVQGLKEVVREHLDEDEAGP